MDDQIVSANVYVILRNGPGKSGELGLLCLEGPPWLTQSFSVPKQTGQTVPRKCWKILTAFPILW
jgi:hypothetical protein